MAGSPSLRRPAPPWHQAPRKRTKSGTERMNLLRFAPRARIHGRDQPTRTLLLGHGDLSFEPLRKGGMSGGTLRINGRVGTWPAAARSIDVHSLCLLRRPASARIGDREGGQDHRRPIFARHGAETPPAKPRDGLLAILGFTGTFAPVTSTSRETVTCCCSSGELTMGQGRSLGFGHHEAIDSGRGRPRRRDLAATPHRSIHTCG